MLGDFFGHTTVGIARKNHEFRIVGLHELPSIGFA
jgi:hypothetical protein